MIKYECDLCGSTEVASEPLKGWTTFEAVVASFCEVSHICQECTNKHSSVVSELNSSADGMGIKQWISFLAVSLLIDIPEVNKGSELLEESSGAPSRETAVDKYKRLEKELSGE